MRILSPGCSIGVALVVAVLATACASLDKSRQVAPIAQAYEAESGRSLAEFGSTADRKIVRSADLAVSVTSPGDSMREVERIVDRANGFVEESTTDEDFKVRMYVRVPSTQLIEIMDTIAALGKERRRSITATDVTDRYTDLETRLRNSRSLRDRLRQLLDRATKVKDVLAIEKELNRVQSEIETMEARFERLNSQIELSALSISLQRKRILGPLGYAAYGLWWGFSKLFVIR